jgi:cytochrome c-type biogenesis protein CcsB
MINTIILSIVTFIYFFAFIAYLLRWIVGRPRWGVIGTGLTLAGFILHAAGFFLRWYESYLMGIGRIPMTNFYESLIFFAGSIIPVYLVVERRIKNRAFGVFVLPIAIIAMAFASFSPNIDTRIQPLIPALQSNWLTIHVVTCFLGYAGFTLSFAWAIIYFLKAEAAKRGRGEEGLWSYLPGLTLVDEMNYQAAVFGFVFLTLGIMSGSVWAYSAWGAYWSWDPKETWSLITWLIYALLIHARYLRGWRGKRLAAIAIVGFASMLFTYLGVNYLPGLHSYL